MDGDRRTYTFRGHSPGLSLTAAEVEHLAARIEIAPEDVDGEMILAYLEELQEKVRATRAVPLRGKAAPVARADARDYSAEGVRPPSPAAAKIEETQAAIRHGTWAEEELAREKGTDPELLRRHPEHVELMERAIRQGEEAVDELAAHEERLYASLHRLLA
jgi:hypothetical protein